MTLHEAMIQVLRENKRSMTTHVLASAIENQNLYRQKAGGFATYSQIGLRAKNYPQYFTKDKSIITLL